MKLPGKSILLIFAIFLFKNSIGQTSSTLFHYYAEDRGHAINFLFFEEQKVYYLSFRKPCTLEFCIESNYMVKADTLKTEIFGSYLIQRNKLFSVFNNNKLIKSSHYKALKLINKETFNCLTFYGIQVDSDKIIIPKHLYGMKLELLLISGQ